MLAICAVLFTPGAACADGPVTGGPVTEGPVIAAPPAAAPPAAPLRVPGIEGADNRLPADSTVWPWIAIGRINREIGGNCTGAVIGPSAVLTAAHCLYNRRDGRWTLPSEVHFVAGYHQGRYAAHAVGRRFIIASGYDPKQAEDPKQWPRDWAVIVLAAPLSIRPIPLSTRAIAAMMAAAKAGKMNCAGYSGDYLEILTRHKGCQLLGETAGAQLLVHRCDVTFGVSGAPLLLIDGGGAEIIGIANAFVERRADLVATAVPVWRFSAQVAGLLGRQLPGGPLPGGQLPGGQLPGGPLISGQ